jgi:hypothetical protein
MMNDSGMLFNKGCDDESFITIFTGRYPTGCAKYPEKRGGFA